MPYYKASDFRNAALGAVPAGWLDITSSFTIQGTAGTRFAGASTQYAILLAPDATTPSARLSLADGEIFGLPAPDGNIFLVARVATNVSDANNANCYALARIGNDIGYIKGASFNACLNGYEAGNMLGLKVVGNQIIVSRYAGNAATDGTATALQTQTFTDSIPLAAGGWGASCFNNGGVQTLALSEVGGTTPPAYTTATGTVSGDAYKIYLPSGLQNTTAANLVVYVHGAGGDQNQFDISTFDTLRPTLIAAGYRILSPNCAGDGWGNDAAQNAIQATVTYILANYNTPNVLVYGVSMGGLNSAISAINNKIPSVRAIAFNSPVLSLDAAYAASFTNGINTAYGGQSGYQAAKPTHDPLTLVQANSHALHDLPTRFYVGSNDGEVPPANHTTPLVAALSAPEKVVRTFATGHVGPLTLDQTQCDDVVTFYARAIANQYPTVSSVMVSPATASVAGAATQQFTATVVGTNSPAQTVTWVIVSGGGSINGSGLFTAPATLYV